MNPKRSPDTGDLLEWIDLVRKGRATPAQAQQLLNEYARHKDSLGRIPMMLRRYVAERFDMFLQGKAPSLDSAFGVIAPAHRRAGKSIDAQRAIAIALLRERIAGKPAQVAKDLVGARQGCTPAQVRGAFDKCKLYAYSVLIDERAKLGIRWSKHELSAAKRALRTKYFDPPFMRKTKP